MKLVTNIKRINKGLTHQIGEEKTYIFIEGFQKLNEESQRMILNDYIKDTLKQITKKSVLDDSDIIRTSIDLYIGKKPMLGGSEIEGKMLREVNNMLEFAAKDLVDRIINFLKE